MTNTPNPRQQDDSLSSSAPGQQTGDETIEVRPPRDHEAAQIALAEVQQWLQRLDLIRDMGHSDRTDDRSVIVERVNEQQLLSHLQARLKKLHPADVGYILEALPTDERGQLWGLIGADRDAEVLLEVSDSVREFLISITPLDEMVEMSRTMNADDLAELAECLPDDIVTLVQEQLTEKERQQLRAALSSDEDSVGAHMDFDLVTIREDVTVETVFRYLRRFESLPPHTDSVFVVDRDDMLKGVLPTDRLLVAEPEKLVSQVMLADSLTFDAPDNIFEAAQAFERYDLVSAPVVGPHGRLIGRLVVSEVVDVIREDVETDLLNQAGLFEEEDLFANVWNSARNRGLWLALNLCTAFFASRVIGLFDDTIERVVALAALMPIVAGIAGNSGNQTMALVIRSMAQGQLNSSNISRLFGKELTVALLNGLLWGGLAGLFAWWLYSDGPHGQTLGMTMMLAMMINLLLAAAVALAVPLFLRRIGRDPAMGSPVLLTFSTDSLGFLIFLGLATLFFR
ncbi:MAG: magnesium transporter [Burkholderiaceae bacterium]